jgi:hypothetical protein
MNCETLGPDGRFRLVTLEDILKRLDALPLMNFSRLSAAFMESLVIKGETARDQLITDKDAAALDGITRGAITECERLGLGMSKKGLWRVRTMLKEHRSWGELIALMEETNRRLIDEMHEHVFLQILHLGRYEKPLDGWDVVLVRFPDAAVDVEEASKCFATDRHTASVFHLMRVLEHGLDGIAKLLNPAVDWYSSWEAYLQKLNAAWKAKYNDPKDPDHRKWTRFFSEVELHFHAIKITLRNPTMHKLEKTYTEEAADQVYVEVRSLMRYLAVELPP